MSSAPLGRWVVVRSDRLMLSVDKADHIYYLGRSRQLPSSQQLVHKYASREQLAVLWHPPHLYVAQIGKNSSFLGPDCEEVPRLPAEELVAEASGDTAPVPANARTASSIVQHASLRFTPSADAREAALHKPHAGTLEVEVPLCDPLTVSQAPDRHAATAATIYFPDELGLPSFTVRFEGTDVSGRESATAAATTKTTAEMLAVPAFGKVDSDDEDEGSETEGQKRRATVAGAAGVAGSSGATNAEAAEKPEWRGLLDVALQEQQRRDAARESEGRKSEGVAPPPALPPPPPSAAQAQAQPPTPTASIPFGQNVSAAARAAPASTEHQKMGFWEWNSHVDGKQEDPKSWRKYNKAVAELLEKAYRDVSIAKVNIPDSAMFDKPSAKGATYGVCFGEKALKGAMIQYALEDPGRFRLVRRTGGSVVDRRRAKKAHVIPSSSSESESESEESLSDSDSDSEESVSSSSGSSSSSESDEEPKKKRKRRS